MDESRRICDAGDVPVDGTLLITLREGFDRTEAILTRLDDGGGGDDDGADGGGGGGGGEGNGGGGDAGGGHGPDDGRAGDVVAFANSCRHWTDVRIDTGSGALVRDGEIVCQRHGATFEKASGHCTFGPCEGSVLPSVEVTVEDGDVYLTDDDYAFEHVGPVGDHDRSSGSRIGFDGA